MIELHHGDCLEIMKDLPPVDMILADPPYGTTQCKWDAVIPLKPMWRYIDYLIKKNGCVALMSAQPFTSLLVASGMSNFKYELIWHKTHPKGHLNAKKQPLRAHENICVFYNSQPTYNPQKTYGHKRKVARTCYTKPADGNSVYGKEVRDTNYDSTERYPLSVQTISNGDQSKRLHPTQKPIELMEYLIKTYTNEGDTVLDFCMGSGTTGVACKNLGRDFIGIEQDKEYFEIAKERIDSL